MFLLYYGPDEFTANEELAKLRETGGFDINQDTFSGDKADFAHIRNICDTLPFLSERRLVVISSLPKPKRGKSGGADLDDDASPNASDSDDDTDDDDSGAPAASAKGKRGKSGGADPRAFVKALVDYVPKLPETTTLVVTVFYDKKDAKKQEKSATLATLIKAAQQHGRAQVFQIPSDAQLQQWITRRATATGVSITPEAARLLIEAIGDSLRQLSGEIEKLAIYVGPGGKISAEAVRALTPELRAQSVFDLTDALARRDTSRALALLHELLAHGESPLGIVALTAAQTRALIQIKALAERGMRSFQIAQEAGLAPFVVDKSLPLTRQFTFAQLEAAHHTLRDIDIALKSSRMAPELALDLLVLQFGRADVTMRADISHLPR